MHRQRNDRVRSAAVATMVSAMLTAATVPPADAQSRTGSKAGSQALFEGSALVVSGTAEILSGTAQLVVASVETTARGIRLVLRPVAHAASAAVELSAAVTVEISHAAWDAAVAASRAAGRSIDASLVAAGDLIETVALSAIGVAGAASVVGSALVVGGIVLAVVADPALESMLTHEVHRCRHAHG